MAQEFITFKAIPNPTSLSIDNFKAYANPTHTGKEHTILERVDSIDSLSEQRHGCYKLYLKNSRYYVLTPNEAKRLSKHLCTATKNNIRL